MITSIMAADALLVDGLDCNCETEFKVRIIGMFRVFLYGRCECSLPGCPSGDAQAALRPAPAPRDDMFFACDCWKIPRVGVRMAGDSLFNSLFIQRQGRHRGP